MSYSFCADLQASPGIVDFRAQLVDSSGANVSSPITAGFVEVGTNGMYFWFTALPDSFFGGVKFYSNASPTDILAIYAINPREIENADVRTGSRMATFVYTAPDNASIAAIVTALSALNDLSDTQVVDAIKAYEVETAHSFDMVQKRLYAVIRGDSIADNATAPTELIYYAPDGVTPRVTHELTDTTRTAL